MCQTSGGIYPQEAFPVMNPSVLTQNSGATSPLADINHPDIAPLGQNPPVSGKAGRNPQDITPVGLDNNVYDVVFCYRKGGSES